MGQTNVSDQLDQGGVILQRLEKRSIPAALKPYLATFKSEHAGFEKAGKAASAARDRRDKALDLVGVADDNVDTSVESLAEAMVGAQMGKRTNPFQAFSKHSPSKLVRLPYAVQVGEVLALVAAIAKKSPAPVVAKAAAACKKNAEAVQSALNALTVPQSDYSTALAARDALLPGCTRALRKLKTQAKAAWDDEPGVYEAMFAPPEKVQAPKKPTKKSNGTAKPATKPAAPA